MRLSHSQRNLVIVIGAIAAVVAVALWSGLGSSRGVRIARPEAIMGTESTLAVAADRASQADQALAAGEAELRRLEALMSTYINDSQLSQLNRAAAGQAVVLAPETLDVLHAARRMHDTTDGAFDVTARPMFQAWKSAASDGAIPSDDTMAEARLKSNWSKVSLFADHVIKASAEVEFDLGGIAKGYAIDRAVDAMRAICPTGGMVDVGGDLRTWGAQPDGSAWTVRLRDPFSGKLTGLRLYVHDAAVCTSGNYARFVTVKGKTFSHIIDPRTGAPADLVPSATVIAPTAMQADAWATALSVLGREGLTMLPKGVDAMLFLGTRENYDMVATEGFAAYRNPPARAKAQPD